MGGTVDILFQTKVFERAEAFLFSAPDAVDDILDGDSVVCLAVAGVSKGHAWRIHLRNRCQCKMRRPVLD